MSGKENKSEAGEMPAGEYEEWLKWATNPNKELSAEALTYHIYFKNDIRVRRELDDAELRSYVKSFYNEIVKIVRIVWNDDTWEWDEVEEVAKEEVL